MESMKVHVGLYAFPQKIVKFNNFLSFRALFGIILRVMVSAKVREVCYISRREWGNQCRSQGGPGACPLEMLKV